MKRTCVFITNEGPWVQRPPLWCDRPCREGSPYCATHHRLCYLPLPARKKGFFDLSIRQGSAPAKVPG